MAGSIMMDQKELIFDRYSIVRPLGSGGWGEVYLAVDTVTGAEVAVKKIPKSLAADPALIDAEIKALAAMDHPGVVKYLASCALDKYVYLITEYVDGSTLEERCRASLLSLPEIEHYALEILDALDHIHSRGVIHSDLKPGNIIITADGHVRLIDFGIVRTASAEIAADIKEIRGTLHYMSPEQAEGKPYDVRSDLFSFAVILYELCTGKKPFEGEYDMAVMYAILYEEPIPPHKINAAVSIGLSETILRLLAKNPSDRLGSAAEVRAILTRVISEPPDAKPQIRRLAVLPLGYPSEDSDSRSIAEGLRDELHSRLRRISDIDLVSPIKIMQLAPGLTDGKAVRDLLGADEYLTGTVRRAAGRIRIYLTLVSSIDDAVKWQDKYDSPFSDLFDIIDTITDRVVASLQEQYPQPAPRHLVRPATTPEAYELYLLARGYYVKNTPHDLQLAGAMDGEALKLDSNYALAMVGLSDCACQRYMNYEDRREQVIAQATELANRALELAPNLPEAYRCQGRIMQVTGRNKEASIYFLKAVTYKEDYYQAYRSLGWLSKACYRYDEALRWVRKSLSINSTDLESILLKGVILFEERESKSAINDFTRCLELRPDYGRAFFYIGMTYFQLGWADPAIEAMQQAMKFGGDINAPYLLGYYYMAKGDYQRSEDILREAAAHPEIAFLAEFHLGMLYTLTGAAPIARTHYEISLGQCRNLLVQDPEFVVAKTVLIRNLAYLGAGDECLKIIKELLPYTVYDGSVSHDIAKTYAILGDRDKAGEYARLAVATPNGPTVAEILLDPILGWYAGTSAA